MSDDSLLKVRQWTLIWIWGVKASSVKSVAVDGQNGRRHQRQVQCCDTAPLLSRQLLCLRWTERGRGYQSVIHSYYVLGDTPDRPGLMVINWMWMMKIQFKFVISSFKVAWRWHIYLFAQWKRSNNIKCWKVYTKQDYTYTRSIIFIYLQKRIPTSLVKCLEWIWLLCCASGSL